MSGCQLEIVQEALGATNEQFFKTWVDQTVLDGHWSHQRWRLLRISQNSSSYSILSLQLDSSAVGRGKSVSSWIGLKAVTGNDDQNWESDVRRLGG